MNLLKKLILTFGAISSVSVVTVMANQDTAAQLDHWYQTAFQTHSETVLQVKEKGLQEIKDTTKAHQLAEEEAASKKIESFFQNALDQSQSSIQNHKKDYIYQLEKTKTDLGSRLSEETTEKDKARLDSEITDDVQETLSEVLGE